MQVEGSGAADGEEKHLSVSWPQDGRWGAVWDFTNPILLNKPIFISTQPGSGGSCKLWNLGKPRLFSIADSTKCALLRLFLKMPPFFVNLIQCGSLPQKDWYCEGHFIWELLPDRSIEQKGGGQSAGKWPRPTLLDSTDASLPSLGVVVTIVLLLLLLGISLLSLILSTSRMY